MSTLNNTAINTDFDAQVLVWNTEGPNANSYTLTSTVAPFQAFMVHKSVPNSNPSTFTIYAAERSRTAGTFFDMNANTLTLVAQNTNNNLLDETVIGFNANATDTFDARYDADKLPGSLNRHTMYSVNNGKWLAKNILHDISTTSTVPVGFEPGATAAYSISFTGINSFDPTSYIYLEDKALNIMHNARNGDYSFTADSADNWNRFVVHFTPPTQIATIDASCTSAGTINIQQPGTAYWNYTITDSSSAIVTSGNLNQSQPVTIEVGAGTYTLTLTDTNGYIAVKTIQVNGPQAIAASFTTSRDTVQPEQNVILTSTSTGGNNYQWNLGNGTTATGTDVRVMYTQPGTYTITLQVSNASGCSSTQTQTITVLPTSTTGLNNISTANLNIWSHGNRIYVDFTALARVDAIVKIYDILGQEISSDRVNNNLLYQKEIDNIEAAYFVVMVKNEEKITTKKVFIINSK